MDQLQQKALSKHQSFRVAEGRPVSPRIAMLLHEKQLDRSSPRSFNILLWHIAARKLLQWAKNILQAISLAVSPASLKIITSRMAALLTM